MIVSAAVPLDHPLRAHPGTVCWGCGSALDIAQPYIACGGATGPVWLHPSCALRVACDLFIEWRTTLLAAEFGA